MSQRMLAAGLKSLGVVVLLTACADEVVGLPPVATGGASASEPEKPEKVEDAGDRSDAAGAHDASGSPPDGRVAVLDARPPGLDGALTVPDAVPQSNACSFSSPPVVDPPPPPGDAGDGGDAGQPVAEGPDIKVDDNAFVGDFLTDKRGYALYIYGADLPGNCQRAPVSNCSGDCLQSWPPFNAGERTLDEGLDPGVFGTIEREDGTHQTTFYGWPLYYFKKDDNEGSINGHGKGKTWPTAELPLPDLLVMRSSVEQGGIKYLADGQGRTLYALDPAASDRRGPPGSECTELCLLQFQPLTRNPLSAVTWIEPGHLTQHVRSDGVWQVSYRGMPLYYSHLDTQPGDLLGTGVSGWMVIEL